jgi:hypothetical protein
MFGLFNETMTPIESYMDELSYFEKRFLITDALHNRDITSPFSKKEIIEYAYKEASESIFNASYNAIQGYENDIYFIGKPEIDPLTGEANTPESQKGLIGKVGDELKSGAVKTALIVGGGLFAFYYISEKAKKYGKGK